VPRGDRCPLPRAGHPQQVRAQPKRPLARPGLWQHA
jgi:hypothetical protein